MIALVTALVLAGPPTLAATLHLDDAAGAVTFLLEGGSAPAPAEPSLAQARAGDEWDGSLPSGIVRSLFWGYRFFLSSQDTLACGFEPSCSHFGQEAIEEHGFIEGALATLDRLSRDTPLAIPFYPIDLDTGLLKDPPEQYCLSCK
ncbi:MAG TPA: membrane protein insertion efficiency factor YidD [Myxococcales bacterium]|nr:membrane protein insertion efficiency factor YidD [Myxococcales bacterium]